MAGPAKYSPIVSWSDTSQRPEQNGNTGIRGGNTAVLNASRSSVDRRQTRVFHRLQSDKNVHTERGQEKKNIYRSEFMPSTPTRCPQSHFVRL